MNKILIRVISIACILAFWSGSVWAEEHEGEQKAVVKYYDLSPAFVANYGTSSRKLKFVKADVSIRSSSDEAISAIVAHEPLVRHQIVMLLSRQTEDTLSTTAGQEALRQDALKVVQEVLKKETGNAQIDDLLFTSFVVQR